MHRRVALIMKWYVYRVHLGIARYAEESGWLLQSETAVTGKIPHHWKGDGIVGLWGSNSEAIEFAEHADCPIVHVGPHAGVKDFPTVWPDDRRIGKRAADHLLSRGYRHLAYATFGRNAHQRLRRESFRQEVLNRKRNFYDVETDSLQRSLRKLPKPLAILTENDAYANQVLHACVEADLKIPEEVAVLGVDNDPLYVNSHPVALSSVKNSLIDLGYQAAALLDRIMSGEEPPPDPVLVEPGEVITRGSTDILVAEHPAVEGALRHIHENYQQPINIDLLAGLVGLSRRRLEDLFKRETGHSMPKEILRLRLRDAIRMLTESDIKVGAIADHLGFANHSHLTKVFRKECGMSPSEWRRQHSDGGFLADAGVSSCKGRVGGGADA